MKLGALVSVGIDLHQPVISGEVAQWAIDFVTLDITTVMQKFTQGDVGQGETKQESDIKKAIETYLNMDKAGRRKYKVIESIVAIAAVPYAFISRRVRQRASFKNDRKGANAAIQSILDEMVKSEVLVQIPKQQARSDYKANCDLYMLGPHW